MLIRQSWYMPKYYLYLCCVLGCPLVGLNKESG